MTPGNALLVDEVAVAAVLPEVAPELVSDRGVTVEAVDARASSKGASLALVVDGLVTGVAGVGFTAGWIGASRFEVAICLDFSGCAFLGATPDC